MSFTCENCGIHQLPRTKPIMKVVETRRVEYDGGFDEEGIENPPTSGTEIVREVRLCGACYQLSSQAS
jgi:hypothetical protein